MLHRRKQKALNEGLKTKRWTKEKERKEETVTFPQKTRSKIHSIKTSKRQKRKTTAKEKYIISMICCAWNPAWQYFLKKRYSIVHCHML